MGSRSEGFFVGFNETKLYFQTWKPDGPSRGLIIITHGHGEHSESYIRLADALKNEWTLLAWDLRGHGRSEGQRGYAKSFLDYVRDFEMLWNQVLPTARMPGQPVIFFSHSMGALIQLKALGGLLGGEEQIQILSSPFLGLSMPVPAIKDRASYVLRYLMPHLTLDNEIDFNKLTRDPNVVAQFEKDSLRHSKISAEVYLGGQECQASVLARPEIWEGPLCMLLAENDPVVSTPINLKFYESLTDPKKQLTVFPDRCHELVNDLGREEVFAKIRDFLRPF